MCLFQSVKVSFNKVKGLLHIVFGVNVFNQLIFFFNRVISLKSSEINKLYGQINLLNSLKTQLYKLAFRELRHNFEFLSVKNCHSYLEIPLSKWHNCSGRLKILVDYGGILAWLELEELKFCWLGKATIRFCSSCASGCVPSVIPSL